MAASRPRALLVPLLLLSIAGGGAGACDSGRTGVRPDPAGEDGQRVEVVAAGELYLLVADGRVLRLAPR